MDNFVAIDVETANATPSSICAVGAVKVIDGIITDTYYTLVRPTPNYFLRRFSEEIHGIDRTMTDPMPTFDKIFDKLTYFVGALPLVAHNAQFDHGCLRAASRAYGLSWPGNEFMCTLRKARNTIPRTICHSFALPSLAHFLGIPFHDHHNAMADAEVCAKIAQVIL